jgi:hypothetical protein
VQRYQDHGPAVGCSPCQLADSKPEVGWLQRCAGMWPGGCARSRQLPTGWCERLARTALGLAPSSWRAGTWPRWHGPCPSEPLGWASNAGASYKAASLPVDQKRPQQTSSLARVCSYVESFCMSQRHACMLPATVSVRIRRGMHPLLLSCLTNDGCGRMPPHRTAAYQSDSWIPPLVAFDHSLRQLHPCTILLRILAAWRRGLSIEQQSVY